MIPDTLTLTPDELRQITGYTMPARQLQALHAAGYWRARRNVLGTIILTRAHYDAVERGEDTRPGKQPTRPKLRLAANT